MKRMVTMVAATMISIAVFSQTSTSSTKLKDTVGKQIISSTFDNDGKPYIVCFWSPSKPDSHTFLDAMNISYKSWQRETGVKVIAVAVEEKSGQKILPFIQSHHWNYEHYIDDEQGYRQLMHVTDIPYIFVFNGKKEIVLQLRSFQPGDELIIHQALIAKP